MNSVRAEPLVNAIFPAEQSAEVSMPDVLTVREYVGWEALQRALTVEHLEAQWEALLTCDETASFYQTPLWCLTWYRCYQDEYEPLVITTWQGTTLSGLVPCARERRSNRLIFAGAGMSDYRDVVTSLSSREACLDVVLPRMEAHAGGHPIAFGHTQPQSPTTALVEGWAQNVSGHGTTRTSHPCQRFTYNANSDSQIDQLHKKKTIRQAFTYYKRAEGLSLQLIQTMAEWESLQRPYFTQHCLRQAGSGREESFEDPRKQQLYAQLFASGDPAIHFSCLWTGDKPLAFAFCFAYRKVLYYGTPSFDILETKHSPGMLHIIELVKRCHQEHYVEVDLTLGSASFKGRVGNRCMQLPTVYLYASRTQYWTVCGMQQVKASTKSLLQTLSPDSDLLGRLKTFSRTVAWYRDRFSQTTWPRIARYALERISRVLHWNYCADIYELTPERFAQVKMPHTFGPEVEFHTNQLDDFLTLHGREHRDMAHYIQDAVQQIHQGRSLHTVLIDGELAHFGWSYRPSKAVWLPETESQFVVPDQAASLYQFYTCEEFRRRKIYTANLAHIAKQEFAHGASTIYIVCERRNVSSSSVIQRVGFIRRTSHWLIRWVWWKRKGSSDSSNEPNATTSKFHS